MVNSFDLDNICTGSSWPQRENTTTKSLGGPSTDADYDMEGPFQSFVAEIDWKTETAKAIRTAGKPIRDRLSEAASIQDAA